MCKNMNDCSKLLVIIPAYNEEASLVNTIEKLKSDCPETDYVIVNDGSSDCTRLICKEKGYNLIDFPVNLGLTNAFRAGLRYAMEKKYEYVMQFDADGQHRSDFIEGILASTIKNKADVCIGSRHICGGDFRLFSFPSTRIIGAHLIRSIIFLKTKKRITDPTSGMRLYNKRAMELIYSSMLGPEPDALVHLLKNNLSITEFPVRMMERQGGKSYLNITNSIRYMLHICFSILFLEFFRRRALRCQ